MDYAVRLLPAMTSSVTQIANAQSAGQAMVPSHWHPPESPIGAGCYHYTKPNGWMTMPCTPDSHLKKDPKNFPQIEAGNGIYGVRNGNSVTTHGETSIYFQAFSGESDSKSFDEVN